MTARKYLHLSLGWLAALALAGCPERPAASGVVDPSGNNAVSAGARAQIRTTLAGIEKACQAHNAAKGELPADLQALIDGGNWHDKDRKDPWGNDWVLVVEGNEVTAWSYGKDGAPGGEGENEDYKGH